MEKNKKSEKKGGIKAFFKSRKTKHGSLAIAITAVVIALVIILNFVTSMLVDRFPNLKLDLTSTNAFALQDDTEEYMSHLKKDIKMYILSSENTFVSNGQYFVQAKNLLDKMESASDGKFKVEFVDTTTDPSFTKKYTKVDWSSSDIMAIVECGEQYQALKIDECFTYNEEYASYGYYDYESTTIEQAAVKAVLNVTTEDKVVVDFIKGNQEEDYSGITSLLTSNAYQVNEISLQTQDIDENAQFVFLYAPAVDLDDDAIEKISAWLENGGNYGKNLIYLPSTDNTDPPNISDLLEEWGMKLSEGFVFETSQDYILNGTNRFAFLTDYTDYYKENLKNPSIPVVGIDCRGIEITDENAAHAILNTSSYAGIMPYEPADDWDYNDAVTGEPIAVAAEGIKSGNDAESRIVVFSSYMMLSQNILSLNSFNNSAFVMNVVNTIADKEDDSITIESKDLGNTELGVTDAATANAMNIIFIVAIPVVVLAVGIVIWIRRRNK